MSRESQPLYELWRKIDLRLANEQERIDAAVLSGKSKYPRLVPRLNIDPNGKVSVEAGILTVAVVVAALPAVVHAVRMQTDAKYRQQVVTGARLTAETATAMASSALSKRTEKDDKADMIPGSKSEDRGDRGVRRGLAKIAKGETLTKEDVEGVEGYAIGLVSQGKLRLGLQFINGQLTFVRLSIK